MSVFLIYLFKFIHIAAAMVWVGGVCALAFLDARLVQLQDQPLAANMAKQTAAYGQVVLGLSAGLTLIAGLVTAILMHLDLLNLWILWGFAGIFGSLVLGAVFIRRSTVEFNHLVASPNLDDPRLAAVKRRLANLNLLNLLLLLSVVAAMVFKP
jgi:uncharacterized membrane protein